MAQLCVLTTALTHSSSISLLSRPVNNSTVGFEGSNEKQRTTSLPLKFKFRPDQTQQSVMTAKTARPSGFP